MGGISDPDLELSTDPSRLDMEVIHGFLTQSYWAPGIPREVVARAIAHSRCIGAYRRGAQVGFARVVSDHATFAYLADVFVIEACRGRGIARAMVQQLLADPELANLRRWMLITRDAHALYAGMGFVPARRPENIMELHRPGMYQGQR